MRDEDVGSDKHLSIWFPLAAFIHRLPSELLCQRVNFYVAQVNICHTYAILMLHLCFPYCSSYSVNYILDSLLCLHWLSALMRQRTGRQINISIKQQLSVERTKERKMKQRLFRNMLIFHKLEDNISSKLAFID